MILSCLAGLAFKSAGYYSVFIYTGITDAFFLVCIYLQDFYVGNFVFSFGSVQPYPSPPLLDVTALQSCSVEFYHLHLHLMTD